MHTKKNTNSYGQNVRLALKIRVVYQLSSLKYKTSIFSDILAFFPVTNLYDQILLISADCEYSMG